MASPELARLLARAGVTPFRRVGKVRAAYDPRTPNETIQAAVRAVKQFAPALVDLWGEPAGSVVHEWRAAGLAVADVCDDPCPKDVDPLACPPGWLVGRCARYHFRLTSPGPGKLLGVGADGWEMDAVRPLLPGWFVDASRKRYAELVELVAGAEPPPEPEPPAELPWDSTEAIGREVRLDRLVETHGIDGTHPDLADALQWVTLAGEARDIVRHRAACTAFEDAVLLLAAQRQEAGK